MLTITVHCGSARAAELTSKRGGEIRLGVQVLFYIAHAHQRQTSPCDRIRPCLAITTFVTMDPVTALSVVSAAFSIVTFAKDLIKGAIFVHDSIQNDEIGSRSRESVVSEMQKFSSTLTLVDGAFIQQNDPELYRLASDCRTLSEELIRLVTKLKPKDPNSKSKPFERSSRQVYMTRPCKASRTGSIRVVASYICSSRIV